MKKMLSLVMALALILSCLCLPASAEVAYNTTLRVEVFDRSIAGLNLEDCWQLRYAQEHFGNPNKIKVTTKPDGTGETPWDVNIVFTYKLESNK